MSRAEPQSLDRRQARTRSAIITAFNELVRERRLEDIRVPDVIDRANVGRSTFYEHFSNVTDVYLTAFSRPLSVLAEALSGTDNRSELLGLLDHLWENRHQARSAFSDRGREQLCRLLRTLIDERCPLSAEQTSLDNALERVALCEGVMGLIRAWLVNDVAASSAEITDTIRQLYKAS